MRSKSLRSYTFQVHRYLGLLVGLVLCVVGLTGSLLVFEPELHDLALHHELGQIIPQGERLSPDALVSVVQTAYANQPTLKVDRITLSAYKRLNQNGASPVKVSVTGEDNIWIDNYVNPYTGKILAQHNWDGSGWGYLFELHYQLLAGKWGLYLVGIVGLLATLLSVTGILLWPGWRKLIAGFAIKIQAHPKRRNFDIHKVAGIVTAIFLAMTTFTGFCWNFWDWSVPTLYAATLSAMPEEPVSQLSNEQPINITNAIQKADMSLAGKTIMVALPKDINGAFEVRKQLIGDVNYWGEHSVYIDQYSGEVLRIDTTATNSFTTKLINSFATIHYGTFGGIYTRILYLFVGLAPTILLFTGFVMYRYRRS